MLVRNFICGFTATSAVNFVNFVVKPSRASLVAISVPFRLDPRRLVNLLVLMTSRVIVVWPCTSVMTSPTVPGPAPDTNPLVPVPVVLHPVHLLQLLVHGSHDEPEVGERGMAVPPGQEIFVAVGAEQMFTTGELKRSSLSVTNKRRHFLPDCRLGMWCFQSGTESA